MLSFWIWRPCHFCSLSPYYFTVLVNVQEYRGLNYWLANTFVLTHINYMYDCVDHNYMAIVCPFFLFKKKIWVKKKLAEYFIASLSFDIFVSLWYSCSVWNFLTPLSCQIGNFDLFVLLKWKFWYPFPVKMNILVPMFCSVENVTVPLSCWTRNIGTLYLLN